jgi:hypothetical protein
MMNELQIEQELVRVIEAITGIANANIRISYQTSGMPSIDANTDYCFISLSFFDNNYTKPIKTDFDGEQEIETYSGQRGIVANLVFYGNNAFDYASKVRVLTKDSSYMKTLRRNDIYLICDTSEPRRVPILLNQQWYNQVFLDLRFYQKIMYNVNRNAIESVEIHLISDHNEQIIEIEKGGN